MGGVPGTRPRRQSIDGNSSKANDDDNNGNNDHSSGDGNMAIAFDPLTASIKKKTEPEQERQLPEPEQERQLQKSA